MPTAAERQALAFLTGVALLGGGVRAYQARTSHAGVPPPQARGGPDAVAAEGVGDQLRAIDSAKRRGRARAQAPGGAGDAAGAPPLVVDIDAASATELEELPYIGKALAQRIVANRESLGTFGSLEALGRVRGIGAALEKRLAGMVTFSGTARDPPEPARASSRTSTEAAPPRAPRSGSRAPATRGAGSRRRLPP